MISALAFFLVFIPGVSFVLRWTHAAARDAERELGE